MELRKVFDQYDKTQDGIIEMHEFKEAMKNFSSKFTDEDIETMFASIVSLWSGYNLVCY